MNTSLPNSISTRREKIAMCRQASLRIHQMLRWTGCTYKQHYMMLLGTHIVFYIYAHINQSNSKQSLQDIAATNPGDGTMRLYGETTFIHDADTVSDNFDMTAPTTPVRKSTASEEMESHTLSTPAKRSAVGSIKSRTRSPLQVKECFVYLEDLEPRGSVFCEQI